ncbi:MAG: tRNA 2-thiouridine(34) synthase MnmA, partial [Flavobacteriales bacterium]
NDALEVAETLGIPYQAIDLSEAYRERIVEQMFDEYRRGRTPNPDILCNREIKFDPFLKAALRLNADAVATGHYCRKVVDNAGHHRLLEGKDPNKDQSYFLCQITQEQLQYIRFPLGEYDKEEVRAIARKKGLPTAEKKDSQGLCFIGKISLPEFLSQRLEPKEGAILEVPKDDPVLMEEIPAGGETEPPSPEALTEPFPFQKAQSHQVGRHQGAHFFTVGQRKGIGVGGKAEPLFVLERDVEQNLLYVGQGTDHPGLYRPGLFVPDEALHWVRPDQELPIGSSARYEVRIRHRQPLQKARLVRTEKGVHVLFDKRQRGIAAGQSAAWYQDGELMGSGVIDR